MMIRMALTELNPAATYKTTRESNLTRGNAQTTTCKFDNRKNNLESETQLVDVKLRIGNISIQAKHSNLFRALTLPANYVLPDRPLLRIVSVLCITHSTRS
jgi:hypothetical protein